MKAFFVLLKKEVMQEIRAHEVTVVAVSLSLLLSVLSGIGVQFALLNPAQILKIAPIFIWLTFLFSATAALGRSYDGELQFGGIDGLKLSGVAPVTVYLTKVIVSTGLLFLCHVFSSCALMVFLDLALPERWPQFLIISLVTVTAYAALAVLFSAVAAVSRLKALILPLILFPLLFPLFMAALESTNQLLIEGYFEVTSFWFSLSLLLMIIYVMLGFNLYGFAVEE